MWLLFLICGFIWKLDCSYHDLESGYRKNEQMIFYDARLYLLSSLDCNQSSHF